LKIIDARQWRALLEHLEERRDRLLFALDLDLDAPIVQISDASCEVPSNGLLVSERPVGDSLHTPTHENSGSDE
jgi:hypothetical protein